MPSGTFVPRLHLVALFAMAFGAWRLVAAMEQWRLWRYWRLTDPSAAELYELEAQFFAALALIGLVVAVAALRRQVTLDAAGPFLASPGAHRRRALMLLAVGALLGFLLHSGQRWFEIDRCLDRGQRWEPTVLLCVSWR